jgi:hypothetical protein
MAKKDTPIHKHAGGRPTIYTAQLADQICKEIAQSEKGLHRLHRELDWFPDPSTIMDWLSDKPEFSSQYARAKSLQADFMGDSLLPIADDTSNDELITKNGVVENREFVNRSKIRIETRMWLMERLAPKKYGKQIEDTETKKYEPPQINVHISPEAIAKAKEAQE